ncbi:LysR family transcriptional regulator [Paludibacterium paludis]|uniref:LysR family transcriptional regulator n=1 Tax=Paludibacterium paludis TaxID=1225769 RepID=A0A918NY12_9NEIS|nr:LysR family transcriptional regulator [Paludibacterium paludis]GGY04961.1 LysR family transcriptional regulator [Paludibacterium paludis]
MSVSLRHIEIFWAVMTAGSVTEAARLLATSQPTVSRELARFETLTGLVLFERARGRLVPTRQALMLFDEVRRSYFGLERIVNAAEALRQFDQGQISMVCQPGLAQTLMPSVCRRFLARYPGVSLSLIPQDPPLLDEWLAAQRHDLGLTEGGIDPRGTRVETVLTTEEVCVLPEGHPLAAKRVLDPADFSGLDCIYLAESDPYRQQVDEVFHEHGVTRRPVVETHSSAALCEMVIEGVGAAIVNAVTALGYRGRGLAMRRFRVAIPYTVALALPLYRPPSQSVDRFVDVLKERCGEVEAELAAALGE